MWMPTNEQLGTVAEMASMPSERIAAAVGIPPEVFTRFVARLETARALDDAAVDRLLYPPRPVAIKPPPVPHDPRIVAERVFETSGGTRAGCVLLLAT
jgi:hypothetical protein